MTNIPRLFVIGLLAQLGFSSLYALDLEDQFELKGRPEGTLLDSSNAGNSPLKWIASSNLRLTGSGCVVFADAGSGIAKVPIEGGSNVVTVSARLWPRTIESGKNTWLAVGVGNPAETRKDVTWSNGLFLLVNTSGYFQCFVSDASGKMTKLAEGAVSDFRPADFNEARLEYRRQENTLALYLNGTAFPRQIDLSDNGGKINPAWAGISGGGQPSNQPSIANFVLKTKQ
ncbi:MAG: hypothetical protein ACFUZC_03960 [Chthoniobacteraceae bacterium]